MLEQFVKQNPSDPFPRYSLALECMNNLGDLERAAELFAELTTNSPDYVATYLMYGGLQRRTGELDLARHTFEAGIAAANRAGDGHASSELQAALAELDETA